MNGWAKTPEAAMAAYVAAYQESAANMRTLLDAATAAERMLPIVDQPQQFPRAMLGGINPLLPISPASRAAAERAACEPLCGAPGCESWGCLA